MDNNKFDYSDDTGDKSAHKEAANAEGLNTIAFGKASHAEGYTTRALGSASHAEGASSRASGMSSHAEGVSSLASDKASHAEGDHTLASGNASHAEGCRTKAAGLTSHSQGFNTAADGCFSHAEGRDTDTKGLDGAHVMGKYGSATHPYSWHLANGTGEAERGMAARIQYDGFAALDMGWMTGNAGYAEAFETVDGKTIDCGYFVTLRGRKVRKIKETDSYVLGVTSAAFAIAGNSGELRWKNKYLTDKWGRIRSHDVTIPDVRDEDGNIIIPRHIESQPVINPEWNNDEEYIPRLKRPGWVTVVLKGQVLVRDNGRCSEDGYCRPSREGIAIPWLGGGYRVMERTGPNQILILLK